MPLYDYRCETCDQQFVAKHGFNDPIPACPACGANTVRRLILKAPSLAQGMLADAGDGRSSSKEQLQNKWAEETPKLRKKLVDKLGEETVNKYAPTLNNTYE